ncbi:MAG: hypothetical protein LBC03_00355 [Nitrososphaerota archaeon]|nr:hypothetical protein [Nitrososphaerota archaeon]
MILKLSKDKLLELVFLTGFSIVVFVVFYCLTSIGGAVIGNDGSVHLGRAQEFLSTGQISLANLSWTPPMYQILLAFLIALTGITNIDQLLLLVKVSAIVVNWLMFFSMYLLCKRFFDKKTGMVATGLLLLCFPMFELNMWGGYTSVLGIAFMLLVFLYLPLSVEHKSYLIVVGVSAFALVLSHQLTLFVAALILAPVMLFLIIKYKGKGIKALLFIIVGSGVAFFLYYLRAMLPYLGDMIEHIFFAQKAMSYQIPQTSLAAFWSYFGFVLLLGTAGLFVAVYKLWFEKKHVSNLTLVLSFIIPLVLMKSYIFGLYLPFQWFVYYVMPPLVIFAAVFLFFAINESLNYYRLNKARIKRVYVKVVVVGLIILCCFALVMRGNALGARISGDIPAFATSDSQSLQVGKWFKDNYPASVSVVVTEAPGFWFSAFCEKDVIVEINPAVERNVVSESILALSYEIESPLSLLRAYGAKGDLVSEYYVSVNDVWRVGTFCSIGGDYVSYNVDGVYKVVPLSQMGRYYTLDRSGQTDHNLTIVYANDDILMSQSQLVTTSSYAAKVSWDIAPVNNPISNVTLYLSTFVSFNFEKAYLPGILNWENPWDNPTDTHDSYWAVTDFSKTTLTDDYIAIHDEQNQIYYAMKFNNLPDWGNIGAVDNMQIDAIRLNYKFEQVSNSNHASFSYQTLIFAEESYHQTVLPSQIKDVFTTQPANYFTIDSRDYLNFIRENNVGFIIYDKNKLDPNIVRCGILEIVYSNDRYAVFRVNY